ncbi:MAG: PadR family transcriptional regulator [Bacillota bacterium]|nr:PadR family transcriptional regulator [Bacillota bacterium]
MNFKDFIPMSETAYYILLSLTEERHGYAVMQYVSGLTRERINLGAGTLYGTLSKLEKAKLIIITREEEKRKYYKITKLGEEVLAAEIERIEELYNNGRGVLGNARG